jgi:hypothetical protein
MNDTQNKKITQVTDKSLVVGVDVGLLFRQSQGFDSFSSGFKSQNCHLTDFLTGLSNEILILQGF